VTFFADSGITRLKKFFENPAYSRSTFSGPPLGMTASQVRTGGAAPGFSIANKSCPFPGKELTDGKSHEGKP
jgi:hypothetical protein